MKLKIISCIDCIRLFLNFFLACFAVSWDVFGSIRNEDDLGEDVFGGWSMIFLKGK
jgi:hypothetical protein